MTSVSWSISCFGVASFVDVVSGGSHHRDIVSRGHERLAPHEQELQLTAVQFTAGAESAVGCVMGNAVLE